MPKKIIKLVRQVSPQIIRKKKRVIFLKNLIKKFEFELELELEADFDFFFCEDLFLNDEIDVFLKRFSAIKELRFLFSFFVPAILSSFLPFYSYFVHELSENRTFFN